MGLETGSSDRSIFSIDAEFNSKFAPITKASLAMIRGSAKIVRYFGLPQIKNQYEFYDLEADPEELQDLTGQNLPLFLDMRAELDAELERQNRRYTK